jgi:hypothetical protein
MYVISRQMDGFNLLEQNTFTKKTRYISRACGQSLETLECRAFDRLEWGGQFFPGNYYPTRKLRTQLNFTSFVYFQKLAREYPIQRTR